jgi:single-stranded DNA-binding protein
MTAHVLLTGRLTKAPEQRCSTKTGKSYTLARLRDGSDFWTVFVFSETYQAEVLRLREGDTVTVQGVASFELYTPAAGSPRVNLTVIADCVLALRPPPKKPNTKTASRAQKTEREPSHPERYGREDAESFNDEIPF